MKLLPAYQTLPLLFFPILLLACSNPDTPESTGCGGDSIAIAPTATRQTDPDLFSPPAPPPDGGDGADYCATPVPAATPAADAPTQFVTMEVANLSLDASNQDLAAAAVGDDMLAVAWISDGDIYVALARGGNHFQVRRVDSGSAVSLAFSRANRLHVTYEQDGRILYRAVDQGTHPADSTPIFVESGFNPQVVVDELNWAHILYDRDGSIYKAKHLSGDTWLSKFVAYGSNPAVMPFYNEKELVLWGMPTNTYWFGIIIAAPYNGEIRVFRYLSWFNVWEQIAAFPIPPGELLTGPVGLDFHAVSEDEAWVYATWVTKRPNLDPSQPFYVQPNFEAVNPLFPGGIANPNHIQQGLNAVRWRSDAASFDAGLKQTFPVTDTTGTITFDAWGLADVVVDAEMNLRIGIDPTGGDNPDSLDVVWSAASAPDAFAPFSVSTPAAGDTATVFLHATLSSSDFSGTAVWDTATIQNGILTNGDFESEFILQSTLAIPEGWTAYYQDSGSSSTGGRDTYTVYAAWSSNGGSAWTGPEEITANHEPGSGTTGAIRPDVSPIISMATEPPSVSFFTIYETGDPPPGTDFLRFGRPMMTQCELGTADCTDAPGLPLLPRNVVRPSYRLLVAADPFNPDRAILTWDSLQTDNISKDVYATYVVLR